MNILSIQSSASMQWSLTRKLSDRLLNEIGSRTDSLVIETLDLVLDPPPFMTPLWIAGAFSKTELSPQEQQALHRSDEYIEQLRWADLILLGAPMYNYGMPAALKAWFDQVARIKKTFSFDLGRGDFPIEPILSNKVLVLMTSSGEFGFGKGQVRESFGHLIPHIRACAHYLGVDAQKDFYHIGIEYQEFKDERHEHSKNTAFELIPALCSDIISKYGKPKAWTKPLQQVQTKSERVN